MKSLKEIKFSILELAPVRDNQSIEFSLRHALELAQHAEKLGYERFWLAEHHNMDGIASSATAVLLGFIAAQNIAVQLNQARHIIRDDLMVPFYQPKVRLSDGKVVGFEALLRWQTDDKHIHSPCHIEQAFQDYVLATRISDAIQNKVFKNIAMWLEQGLAVVPISINAAPVEFLKDNYAERLLQRLNLYKIPHHLVEIEITEHILDDRGSDYVIRALNLLKQQGVKIALDDFGTGHSSLTRLRDYPVDCLKIDCEFIRQMNGDEAILAIVQAIIALGPKLALDIVAEGIENSDQLELLKQFGCSIGQGYLFSRAVNAQQATHMMKRGVRLY